MTGPRHPAPTTISEAARRFIDNAPPIRPYDLAPAALAATRRANLAAYAPGGAALANALGVRTAEAQLGSVPVQWVIPQEARGTGVILYFFGGGYITGSPSEDLAITARLAGFTGCKVCVPAYRLAPEHPFPAQRDDALAVYRALLAERGRPVAVAGESAGGNLALALTNAAAAAGLPMPAAVALLSPWSDLTHASDTARTLDGIDPTLSLVTSGDSMANAFAGGTPRSSPEISPLFAKVPKGFPPTLITSGTRDALLSDCARLSTKLRAAGVAAELRVWEGMWHVFEFYPELPEAEASLREIASFLASRLR
jgi:acetyl esterase/lipase